MLLKAQVTVAFWLTWRGFQLIFFSAFAIPVPASLQGPLVTGQLCSEGEELLPRVCSQHHTAPRPSNLQCCPSGDQKGP